MQVDLEAPLRFLKAAFLPDDWIAVLLKRHDTGEVIQRVGPLGMVMASRFQSWLRFKNTHGFCVFVSVNALTPGRRSRTRESVSAVRHVFLDADRDADRVLSAIERRLDLPAPSFVIRTSAGRGHVLWRVTGVTVGYAEALQKHLAQELGTDTAATSTAQLTRLPGFLNRKHSPPPVVTVESRAGSGSYRSHCFPERLAPSSRVVSRTLRPGNAPMSERARRYVAAIPPAVQGGHGDVRTFRLCCRLVGQFGLSDDEALTLLQAWNSACQPPWSRRELALKLRSARRRWSSRHIAGQLLTALPV